MQVASVDIYGRGFDTYEVQLSPKGLRAHQLSLPDVSRAIQANNEARGGATIDRNDEQQIVRGIALTTGKNDITATVLKTSEPGGIPVTVADVAEVDLAPKVRLGAITHDG